VLAYLNGGEYDGEQILRPETVKEMLTPRVILRATGSVSGEETTMVGLGWMLGNLGQPTEWFGYGGAHMWGWLNEYRAYPKLDLAIVVATNRWDMSSSWQGPTILELIADISAAVVADGVDRAPAGAGRT